MTMHNASAPSTTKTNKVAEVSPVESPTDDLLASENPQQGTPKPINSKATPMNVKRGDFYPKTRVPPNIKDSRKLFVGGLPQDGRFIDTDSCDSAITSVTNKCGLTHTPLPFFLTFSVFG